MWLLHEHLRRIVGVYKCLGLELAAPDIVVHATVLNECFHVIVESANLLDTLVKDLDERIDSTIIEPELEMAESGEQVLVGRGAAFEIGAAEERKLDVLTE